MGAKVNEVVRVLNLTGTTEGLFIGNLWVDREDWFYFAFHPFSGFEFKEVEPGIYEHWVHRNEQALLFQGIFHTFPDQKTINLKDLYVKHPSKPNLWAYKGRNDDIIVLSNGYKISPLDTEALITTHPAIEGCLMVSLPLGGVHFSRAESEPFANTMITLKIGSGKAQAGLLIELKDASSTNDELLNSIWSTVERANSMSLHKNQLQKDYIAFAQSDKPFVRTDKGTVKRRATLELYAKYIDLFYESRSEDDDAQYLLIDTSSTEALTGAIRHILGSLLPALKDIKPEDDMFSLGLDSILAFRAVKSIRTATGLQEKLTPRHLYGNPTLQQFASTVWQLVDEAERPGPTAQ